MTLEPPNFFVMTDPSAYTGPIRTGFAGADQRDRIWMTAEMMEANRDAMREWELKMRERTAEDREYQRRFQQTCAGITAYAMRQIEALRIYEANRLKPTLKAVMANA